MLAAKSVAIIKLTVTKNDALCVLLLFKHASTADLC